MDRSKEWLVPLTGVGFVVVLLVSFLVGGEPKSAEDPVNEIVAHYVDNKSSIQAASFLGAAAGLLLIVFGAYLRKVLRAATGPGEMFSLVAFIGLVLVALGFAIDVTISLALAEAAGDIEPVAVQALQALFDNDFIPIALGVLCFLLGTGISVVQSGALPKWIGWLMLLLVVVALTPIGFVSLIAAAILILVISILLSIRARPAPATAAG